MNTDREKIEYAITALEQLDSFYTDNNLAFGNSKRYVELRENIGNSLRSLKELKSLLSPELKPCSFLR